MPSRTKRSATKVFDRFANSPGFNAKKTLGAHKSLPKAPPQVKQEVFSFHQSDTSENIIFAEEKVNGIPQVKAGTLEKLVQRLTHEEYLDPPYTQTFLLTYRTFTTPNQLLNILKARYHMNPPKNAPKDWLDKVQKPIRLRLFNALKNWLLKGFHDFADNPKLRKNLLNFLEDMSVEMASASKNLRNVFDRKMNEARKGRDIIFSKKPPVPILPRSLISEPTLIDFSPLEIARQLTLIESELYRAIKPWELLNQSWAKKDKEKRAPRVLAMINRFNIVSNWIATIIVQTSDIKARVNLQKHVIDIAHQCLSMNNFNAVMEIISGLQASSVYRLKQTRAMIDSKHSKMLEECETAMCRDQNFKNFRAMLHSADPPSIPYLGVYLTDLTFIEDGNSDNVANGLINFVKRQQVFGVINEIQQYQHAPYCLEKVDFIADWLLDVKTITEDECYKISLLIEPRGYKAPEQASSKRKLTSLTRQNSISFRRGTMSPLRHGSIVDVENPYSSPYGELECIKTYQFYDKDSPSNIITVTEDDLVIINGGTLTKLVERLTHEKFPDVNYMAAFLMTFRTFTTPNELLDLLINRFNMPKPKNPSKEQEKNFRTEKLIPIHFRVFNVLKDWITMYGSDFKQDTVLVQRVLDFAAKVQTEHQSLSHASKSVIDAINKPIVSPTEPNIIYLGGKPNLTKSLEEIDLDSLSEQIFSFVCGSFGNADAREYLQGLWKVSEGRFQCIHLHRLFKWTNDFTLWIKTELFTAPDVTTRAKVLAKFIHLADKLSKLKDQHDCFIIINTLEELREKELQITWEWLQPRYLSVWSRLQQFKNNTESAARMPVTRARSQTKAIPPAFIPYLMPVLSVLEETAALPDFCGADDLINFEKRQNMYFSYLPLSQHASGCSAAELFPIDKEIHDYLKSVEVLCEDKLLEAAAQMNNERPEGLPPSEQEKNAMIKNSEASIDDSIKPLLMQLINKDPGFKQFVVEQLSTQIQADAVENVKKEMMKFARISKSLLSLVLAREQRNKATELELTSNIAKEQYPNSKIETWSKVDTNSSVFGWEEEISVVIIENEDEKAIVHARYYAKKPDIATLLRILQFYQEENDDTTTFCSLIVMGIDEEAMEIATANNVSVTKM